MPSVTGGQTGQIKSLKTNEKYIRHSIKYGLESWTRVWEWSLEVDLNNSIYTFNNWLFYRNFDILNSSQGSAFVVFAACVHKGLIAVLGPKRCPTYSALPTPTTRSSAPTDFKRSARKNAADKHLKPLRPKPHICVVNKTRFLSLDIH